MSDMTPSRFARLLADLDRRLRAMERSSQLSRSSVMVDGVSVTIPDSVKTAVTAGETATAAQSTATGAATAAQTAADAAEAAQSVADAAEAAAANANGAALAASQAASTAQQAADSAGSTANGKNRITYSTAVASGTGTRAGDLWFRRDAAGLIIGLWEWTGSAWVSRTLDSQTIANLNVGKLTTGALSAGTRIVAGPETDTHAELTATGFRVYGKQPDGTVDEVIRLGTDTDDYFGVTNGSGDLVASVNDQGGASFTDLTVTQDPVIQGRSLVGKIIGDRPMGLVNFGAQYTAGATTSGELGLYEINVPTKKGRMYEITSSALRIIAGTGSTSVARLRYTLNGEVPTVTSELMAEVLTYDPAGLGSSVVISKIFSNPDNDYNLRVLLSVARITGGNPSIFGNSTGYAIELWAKDVGVTIGNRLSVNNGGGVVGGGGGGNAAPVVKQQYVYEIAARWSQTYKGDNSVRGDTAEMVVGYNGSNGDGRAYFGFSNDTEPAYHIPGILSGATVDRVEVYLYSNHWYYNSGGTVAFGTHGAVGAPGGWVGSTGAFDIPGWQKPGGRWLDLTSYGPGLQNGTIRGFALGPGGGTDLARYGRFNGASMTNAPRLRLTYTK